MQRALLAIVLAGCGRLDFQPLAAPARDGGGGDVLRDAGLMTCDPGAPFGAPVAIAELESANDDWSARFSGDELTAYFASSRPGHVGGASIYTASRATLTGTFSAPVLLAGVNSSSDTIVHPTVTADERTLLVQQAVTTSLTSDIYFTTRADAAATFSTPIEVANINSAQDDLMPFVTPGGGTLLFSSNRGGNYAIYVATGSPTSYGAPQLLPGVSAAGGSTADDEEPVLSADGLTIYFSSTRNDPAFDIWVAHRAVTTDPFTLPHAVAELAAPGAYDAPTWLSSDGCRLYLMSNRAGGAGGIDLYVASR